MRSTGESLEAELLKHGRLCLGLLWKLDLDKASYHIRSGLSGGALKRPMLQETVCLWADGHVSGHTGSKAAAPAQPLGWLPRWPTRAPRGSPIQIHPTELSEPLFLRNFLILCCLQLPRLEGVTQQWIKQYKNLTEVRAWSNCWPRGMKNGVHQSVIKIFRSWGQTKGRDGLEVRKYRNDIGKYLYRSSRISSFPPYSNPIEQR